MSRGGAKKLLAAIEKARQNFAAIQSNKTLSAKAQSEQGKLVMETLRTDIVTVMLAGKKS